GTQRLPRLMGVEQALKMMLSGDPVDATEALRLGIVDRVVTEDLQAAAISYGQELIAGKAPIRKLDQRPVAGTDQLDQLCEQAMNEVAQIRSGEDAPPLIISTLRDTAALPIEEGLMLERQRSSGRLAAPQCLAMRHLFFAQRGT